MNAEVPIKKKKRTVFWMVVILLLCLLSITGIFLYRNFNRLLSESLITSFNTTLVADVYELKFDNLRVNLFERSIRVFNVSMEPREKPVRDYPYINSSFRLKTEKLTLKNVDIFTLLKLNKLILERISITKPEIVVSLAGQRNIMLPFKDSTATAKPGQENKKQSLVSFMLNEFQLIDANFHVTNAFNQREFTIREFNISLHDLQLHQLPGEYVSSFDQVTLGIGEFNGDLKKGPLQHVGFTNFKIGIDTLSLQLTLDTILYRFHDFNAGIQNLTIETADSLFHIAMKSFNLSYKDKSILLKDINIKPNVSHAVLQRKFKFQHTDFSGSIGKLELRQVNFDSLIYARKLFIDEVELSNVRTSIFKDKTKPMDSTRRPAYLGQTVAAIPLPLLIRHVQAMDVELENTERKPDSTDAKVKITRGNLEMRNITNLSSKEKLMLMADAYVNGKVRFKAELNFSYVKPQFNFKGVVKKFALPDLNPLIQAYTPAKINQGIADEISFTGIAEQTKATGTMKFLYHDLEVDLELQKQAKWKSAVVAFAANTALNSSNPVSIDSPARIVKFQIERDMTKGFVNVMIKSILNGLKETMIMNKENRKAYQQKKKESKQENK